MTEHSEIRAGIFVVVALAILGIGSLWIAGVRPLGRHQASYEVEMKGSGGIRRGDPVRMAGVEVGRIEEVRLRPGEEWPVLVRVALPKDMTLSTESFARIASSGLLGSSYLEIETGPPGAAPLPHGARIQGRGGGSLGQTLARVDEAADRLVVLLEHATAVLSTVSERTGPLADRLEGLLSDANLEAAAGTLEALRQAVDDTGSRLPVLVARLESLASEIEAGVDGVPELSADLRALARELRQGVGPEGERLVAVLTSAERAMDSAGGAFGAVAGSAGDLEATLRDLRDAAASLKAFSQALEERPSRVLRNPRWPDRKPGEGVKP